MEFMGTKEASEKWGYSQPLQNGVENVKLKTSNMTELVALGVYPSMQNVLAKDREKINKKGILL